MSDPRFLTVEEVIGLHRIALTQGGGSEGLRDFNGLESAVHAAQNVYFYRGGDCHEIAVAYAFHIAEAQAFLEGNKRTAVLAALTFLGNHGWVTKDAMPLYPMMIAIAEKKAAKEDLVELLRAIMVPDSD